MIFVNRFYPESRFGGFSDIDGTVIFYGRVHALLDPTKTVLDVGCGRGSGVSDDPVSYRRYLRTLRGHCLKVIGLDVDPEASENPGVDEFHLLETGAAWPIPDASIDIVVADFVLEHVSEPGAFFSEVQRVLKPGGTFCARTSNRIGYVGLFAKFIPNRHHVKVLERIQPTRKTVDVFPTCYQCNTVWELRRAIAKAGLEGVSYGYEAEPSYLGFSAWAYVFGKYLHAFTPGFLRTSLFVFARKLTLS